MHLYHFYEKGKTPFLSLSSLPDTEARRVQKELECGDNIFARRNQDGQYMAQRRIVESRMTAMFLRKGGKPQLPAPIYFILAETELDECKAWFMAHEVIKIPMEAFGDHQDSISFTYGDSFPTFEPIFDEKPSYDLYLYDEILDIIRQRGMPPPRTPDMHWLATSYVEAQVWSDEVIKRYCEGK